MRSVSVGQLSKHTSAVLRRLREGSEPMEVTYRGRIVARLEPVEPPADAEVDVASFLTDLDRLAAEIGAHWPAGVSAVDAVREQRRDP